VSLLPHSSNVQCGAITTTKLDNDDWRVPFIHYLLNDRRTTQLAVSYRIWNFGTATAHGRWHRCRPFQSSNTDDSLDNDILSDRAGMVRRINSYARVRYHMPKLVTLWFSIDIVSYNNQRTCNIASRNESIMLQQISSWAMLYLLPSFELWNGRAHERCCVQVLSVPKLQNGRPSMVACWADSAEIAPDIIHTYSPPSVNVTPISVNPL